MADMLQNNFCQNKVCVFWSWWVWNSASTNNFICQTIRLGQCKEILQRKSVKVLFFISTDSNLVPFAFRDLNLNFYSQGKKKKKKTNQQIKAIVDRVFLGHFCWMYSFFHYVIACLSCQQEKRSVGRTPVEVFLYWWWTKNISLMQWQR